MSTAIDFSKYESAAPAVHQIDFSKYESKPVYTPPPPGTPTIPDPKASLKMPEQYLIGGDERQSIPHQLLEEGKGLIRSAAEVSAPNIGRQLYNRVTGKPNNLPELPAKAAAFTLPLMGGWGEAEAVPEASGIPAPRESALPEPEPISFPRGVRALPHGQYEAPASPLPAQKQLGEGIHEGEYMEEPPPVIRGQLQRGAIPQPGGFEPNQPALPSRGQPIRLPAEFPPARRPVMRTTPSTPLEPLRTREIAGPELTNRPIGAIPAGPAPSSNWPPEAEDYPRLADEMKAQAAPEMRRPVTENPVVGSFVRAMQKSGLPIAERPNLLLKGSGRVNRILGPEEDLAGPLTKSVRQAKRRTEQ